MLVEFLKMMEFKVTAGEVPQDLHLGEKLVYAFYVYFMYQKHSFGT